MIVDVILTDYSTNFVDKVEGIRINNKDLFEYIDNEDGLCQMKVLDDGLDFIRKCKDHYLHLSLNKDSYAIIGTAEGEIKIDTKIVDFSIKNDILVMRYIIDDVEREIKIIYRS